MHNPQCFTSVGGGLEQRGQQKAKDKLEAAHVSQGPQYMR